MFLLDFGLGKDTVALVRGKAVPDGGKILFPFSLGGGTMTHEEVAITGQVKKAEKGLFTVLPKPYSIKTKAYFFRNVLEMLFFYDRHPKTAFGSALLVVDPVPVVAEGVDFVRSSFRHVRNHVIVSSNDLYGTCRSIVLSALIDGRRPEIAKSDGSLSVRMDGKEAGYDAEKFDFRKFARDFQIPKTTREMGPKGFRTFTELYNKHGNGFKFT